MKKTFVLAIIGCLWLGCSHERRVETLTTFSPTENPSDRINQLATRMDQAGSQGAAVLSPTWFESAQKSLDRARRNNERGSSLEDIFRETGEGEAQLARAEKYSDAARDQLGDVLEARNQAWKEDQAAREAGATNLTDLTSKLRKAENELKDITKKLEDRPGLQVSAKDKTEVINLYRLARAEGLSKEKLDVARRILEEAKARGAKRYAPSSLASAEQMLAANRKFLSGNPDPKAAEQKREESLFQARHVLSLTEESKMLDEKKPEERVLWIEERLTPLTASLGLADMRDGRVSDQVKAIHAALLRDRKLATTKQPPPPAKEDSLARVTGLFEDKEAEVLRKGDSLIFRLYGVSFPSGNSRLGPENFPLLEKVAEAVEGVPHNFLTVEGHTDATGSKAANQKLSQERAESVKEFLVAKEAVPEKSAAAVGKGFSEPVASNKSAAGRAKNRRVDVVISGIEEKVAE